MSNYYRGVNDVLFGAAMARASVRLYNYVRQKQEAKEVQRVFDELNDTCQEYKDRAENFKKRAEKAEDQIKEMQARTLKIGKLVDINNTFNTRQVEIKQERIDALESHLEKRKQRLHEAQAESNDLRQQCREQEERNGEMHKLLKETHAFSHEAIQSLTQENTQLTHNLAVEEAQSQKYMMQSIRYSGEAINITWAYNKTHAMRVSLESNINQLFDQNKVDYPKPQFEQDVNLQYIAERLTLDQQHYQKLKNDVDHGLDEEFWFPNDEYMENQKEKIRN